jgi:sulfite exporter TauE/SafE
MCGGINLSQTLPRAQSKPAALRPAFLYNLGRVAAYTAIGGAVGALGSVITPPGMLRGAIQLVAGAFMVIMGVNMLGLLPSLRKFLPRLPRALAGKAAQARRGAKSPLAIGLLNGLMPCGPLQAMQLYALATGSAGKGALAMLCFSLGTVPLMFGLGAASGVLGRKSAGKVMSVGAALIVVFGMGMFSQGLGLSGISGLRVQQARPRVQPAAQSDAVIENGVQYVRSTLEPGRYPTITVARGLPVAWTIQAPQGSINGCNRSLIIPAYNIEYTFQPGENVLAFTPDKTGNFPYTCWMGMIRATINVIEPKGGANP